MVAIVNTGMSRCDKVMQLMQSSFLAKHTILLLGIERMLSLEMIGAPFSHAQQGREENPHQSLPSKCKSWCYTPKNEPSELDKVSAGLMAKGIAKSTHQAYQTAQNRFLKFCSENRLTISGL